MIDLPPKMQVELYEQGVLPNPDFKRDHTGLIVRDIKKVKRHIAKHGEPEH